MTGRARTRGEQVVRALSAEGLVAAERHAEAARVVDRVLDDVVTPPSSLRRRLPEVGGYLGAAFVTAAVVLLVARPWAELTTPAQLTLLTIVSVLLLATALGMTRVPDGTGSTRSTQHPVRRRLASTAATAGAAAGGAAALVALLELDERGRLDNDALIGLGTASTFTALVLLGYALAPSLLGLVAAAVGASYAVLFGVQATPAPDSVRTGLGLAAVGALWLVLAERGWWREVHAARGIGLVLLVAGAQAPLADPDGRWVAYLLTSLVAVAGFWLYASRRDWPYLAAGVVSVTVVVPEVVLDVTDGSTLGAGVALLAAGATLLAAALLIQHLRPRRS